MPQYELIYFNVSGRAGIARLLFALADTKFKDTRYNREEWPGSQKTDRARVPFGTLPVLWVDGTFLAESRPINEFLADEFGFLGSSRLERARICMIEHMILGLREFWVKTVREQDEAVKKTLCEKFFGEQLPKGLENLEHALKLNGGGDSYFIGEKISLADVAFLDVSLSIQSTDATILDQFSKLKSLRDRLLAMPTIAKHISTRKLK